MKKSIKYGIESQISTPYLSLSTISPLLFILNPPKTYHFLVCIIKTLYFWKVFSLYYKKILDNGLFLALSIDKILSLCYTVDIRGD